jgi:hypothetical protein
LLFAGILLVRRPRPIHARGLVLRGHLTWLGATTRSGIAWIDAPPAAPVAIVGRVSRSVGLPSALPDVYGLALRVETSDGPADIELASTGLGPMSRFLLLPRLSLARAQLGTLFPYRGTDGPRLLLARTVAPASLPAEGLDEVLARREWRLRLYVARPRGRWHPFAEVSLRASGEPDDPTLRFDAVRRSLPGADAYGWVRALRQPSYRLAQRPSP